MNENKPWEAAFEGSGWNCTREVISVHSMEQQEPNEEDESDAGDYHSTQQEAVAAFSLDNLGDETATSDYWTWIQISTHVVQPISLPVQMLFL